MSKENAARRNRTLRKIRQSTLDPSVKEAIQIIVDLLNPQTGYQVAWPSALAIANRLGRSQSSARVYIRIIKRLGIFNVTQLSRSGTLEYFQQRFGFQPKLDRCLHFGPNIYEVNAEHPIWDRSTKLDADLNVEMVKTAKSIRRNHNKKTTSKLASCERDRPKSTRQKYSVEDYRQRVSETMDRIGDTVANEYAVQLEEEHREAIDELLNGIANDPAYDVANENQVLKHSSSEADDATSQDACSELLAANPSVNSSPRGIAVRQPCSQSLRADAPPALLSVASVSSSENQSQGRSLPALASECRFAPARSAENGTAVLTNSSRAVSFRHQMPEQGVRHFRTDLDSSLKRLEEERSRELLRLAVAYSDRPDG